MNLWMRVGDADDYQDYGDDFDAVAEALRDMQVEAPLRRGTKYGVTAPGFEGQNYISLYWGEDDEPDAVEELSDEDLEELNRRLAKT